jgi:hypothetical protein
MGDKEDFKTNSPVITYLDKETWRLLMLWMDYLKKLLGVDELPITMPIFPHADAKGNIPDPMRPMTVDEMADLFRRFKDDRYHKLPHMTPKDLRHWVKKVLRDRIGMPSPFRLFYQGHSPDEGVDSTYGSRNENREYDIEEIVRGQREYLPDGILVVLEGLPVNKTVSTVPVELESIWINFLSNNMDSFEVLQRLTELKKRAKEVQPVYIVK